LEDYKFFQYNLNRLDSVVYRTQKAKKVRVKVISAHKKQKSACKSSLPHTKSKKVSEKVNSPKQKKKKELKRRQNKNKKKKRNTKAKKEEKHTKKAKKCVQE